MGFSTNSGSLPIDTLSNVITESFGRVYPWISISEREFSLIRCKLEIAWGILKLVEIQKS